ncbi:MAG: aminotransferase class V-fold PLP-dependent enzyme [Ruminiclostridium sp.]|nr:aminotransferase class V-fold PLP-dependent enzyme [Ruminiclostridium sp.]
MIYFDSAATTLQKPPTVSRAVRCAMATMASPGRGDHGPAARAGKLLLACRERAADLFQVGEPDRVILTSNATHGLNIAVKTLVKPGSTVLLSGWEHNAVTRPLQAIPEIRVVTLRTPLFRPDLFLEELDRQLTEEVDVMICTQVSNVFGYVLPVEETAALCRARGVPLMVDASQGAGLLPIRLEDWGADFVAMPGHKGLYGPQGTGLLLCREGGEPILEGGTGSDSRSRSMPEFLPDRLEAGTHNVPGAAGLLVGMDFVRRTGPGRLLRHETALKDLAGEGLGKLPGVQVFHTRGPSQTGVLSFRVAHWDAGELADRLARRGIALRAGLHCASTAHETVGTAESGTLRLSFSAFNTATEVKRFLDVMKGLV